MKAVKLNQFQKLPERDFGEEFDLLYRIKEIRDELGILKDISNHQEIVWSQAFPPKNKKTPYPFKYPHPHEPSVVQSELRDMMDEAKSAQDSVSSPRLMAEEILTQNPDQLVFGPQGKIHCKSGCRLWTTTGLYHYGLHHCDYRIRECHQCTSPLSTSKV